MILGIICIGPSHILHIPNSPYIVMVGLGLGGLGRGFISGFPNADAMKGGLAAFPSKST